MSVPGRGYIFWHKFFISLLELFACFDKSDHEFSGLFRVPLRGPYPSCRELFPQIRSIYAQLFGEFIHLSNNEHVFFLCVWSTPANPTENELVVTMVHN